MVIEDYTCRALTSQNRGFCRSRKIGKRECMEMAMFMETHRILQGDTEIEYAIKTFVGQEYKHIDEFV